MPPRKWSGTNTLKCQSAIPMVTQTRIAISGASHACALACRLPAGGKAALAIGHPAASAHGSAWSARRARRGRPPRRPSRPRTPRAPARPRGSGRPALPAGVGSSGAHLDDVLVGIGRLAAVDPRHLVVLGERGDVAHLLRDPGGAGAVGGLALLPGDQHRRGDEDRRVGAGEDADHHREGEVRRVSPPKMRITLIRNTVERPVISDRVRTSLSERFAIWEKVARGRRGTFSRTRSNTMTVS